MATLSGWYAIFALVVVCLIAYFLYKNCARIQACLIGIKKILTCFECRPCNFLCECCTSCCPSSPPPTPAPAQPPIHPYQPLYNQVPPTVVVQQPPRTVKQQFKTTDGKLITIETVDESAV